MAGGEVKEQGRLYWIRNGFHSFRRERRDLGILLSVLIVIQTGKPRFSWIRTEPRSKQVGGRPRVRTQISSHLPRLCLPCRGAQEKEEKNQTLI